MYVLVKKSKKYKFIDSTEFLGFDLTIKKNKLRVIKEDLKDYIIKDKYLKNFEKLVKNILIFLETDDEEEGAAFLLDELAREYVVFKNKYLKEFSVKARYNYNRKVRLLANELNKYVNIKEMPKVKGKSK